MTTHLIDGHAGKAHVTSDDLAELNTALIGTRNGVFDYGSRFRATPVGASSVAVHDGVGVVHGRRFRVTTAEQLAIDPGTSGVKRIDLICAVYQKASSTGPDGEGFTEGVTLAVVKGTPSASAPTAPSAPDTALPLWRVAMNGTAMGAPERAFDLIPDLRSLRVEKLYENDFWRVVRHGGAVSVFARGIITALEPHASLDCKYRVPEGLRPAVEVLAACCTQNGDGGAGFIRVKPDGAISVGQLGGAGTAQPRYGQLTWVPGM